MEEHHTGDGFTYTYSAREQEEVKRIREKYVHKEDDKMERLRKLDRDVTRKATASSVSAGVIGALILGTGMCCAMVWAGKWFIPGVLIGLVGIAVIAAAYPLYQHIIKKEREKIAPEILRLTDELMK